MSRNLSLLSPAAVLALAGAALAGNMPTRYSITDLGTLGGPWSNGIGINDLGHVVGHAEYPNLNAGPFVWRDGMISAVPGLHTSNAGSARAINSSGHIVGYSHTPAINFPGTVGHAFFYSPETGAVDLMEGTDAAGTAWDINASGQIVGDRGNQGIFLWTVSPAGVVTQTQINHPGPAGFGKTAESINDAGVVAGAGWIDQPEFMYRAYVWRGNDQPMTFLSTLGGRDSSAYAINNSNVVSGDAQPAAGPPRPVVWRPNLAAPDGYEIVDIGVFGGEYDSGSAWSINDSGFAVGSDIGVALNGVIPRAWIWDGANPKVGIDTLLSPEDAATWTIWWALAINNEHQITGIATRFDPDTNEETTRAILLDPITVCSADFDGSGNVDATDIFTFLDAWFAQNGQSGTLTADFDGSGTVDATDIFTFLDAWFDQNGTCTP